MGEIKKVVLGEMEVFDLKVATTLTKTTFLADDKR